MRCAARFFGSIAFWSLVAIASIHFAHWYMVMVWEHVSGPASFEELTKFTAAKPFQNRVLPCLLAAVLEFPSNMAKEAFPWLPPFSGLDLAYMGLIALSVFGLLLVFKELLMHFGVGRVLAYPLSFTILYPVWVNHVWLNILRYPSDVPSIFFFALGLLFLLRRRWLAYYLVFFFATLNRETSCFLTVAMLCLFLNSQNHREMTIHCVVQFLIWMSLKVGLYLIFLENPGSTVEWPVLANLRTLEELGRGADINMFGKLGGNANWLFFAFGGVWAMVPFAWRNLPSQLKRLGWLLPPYVLGFFIVTIIWEVRAYNEMVVLLPLFVILGLAEKLNPQKEIIKSRISQE